jgi:hypothetical protein
LALDQEPAHRVAKRMSIGLGWLIVRPRRKPTTVFSQRRTWRFKSFTVRSVDRLRWSLLERSGAAAA